MGVTMAWGRGFGEEMLIAKYRNIAACSMQPLPDYFGFMPYILLTERLVSEMICCVYSGLEHKAVLTQIQ